jgi:hypothetical protein
MVNENPVAKNISLFYENGNALLSQGFMKEIKPLLPDGPITEKIEIERSCPVCFPGKLAIQWLQILPFDSRDDTGPLKKDNYVKSCAFVCDTCNRTLFGAVT